VVDSDERLTVYELARQRERRQEKQEDDKADGARRRRAEVKEAKEERRDEGLTADGGRVLFAEPHVSEVAFSDEAEDTLAFSGRGFLSIKTADFPAHAQSSQGAVIGFVGSKVCSPSPSFQNPTCINRSPPPSTQTFSFP